MRDRWLELRAVREHWPISQDARERIVYESLTAMLDKNIDPKLRHQERVLLAKMGEANRVKGLPEQERNIQISISINDVLEQLGKSVDAVDYRPTKSIIGGDDDYAD
jgi:hypothetical protein